MLEFPILPYGYVWRVREYIEYATELPVLHVEIVEKELADVLPARTHWLPKYSLTVGSLPSVKYSLITEQMILETAEELILTFFLDREEAKKAELARQARENARKDYKDDFNDHARRFVGVYS